MTFTDTEKALRAAEKALQKTRQALDAVEEQKNAAIRKAGQSGKLPNLTEINASIEAAKGKLTEAESILVTMEATEAEAVRALEGEHAREPPYQVRSKVRNHHHVGVMKTRSRLDRRRNG